jgi:large subunit ribosomal protein L17
MRHQVRGRKLSRTSAHKKALKRNLLSSLFTYERIETTVAKAKEFRPNAERLITLAKERTLHNIRLAMSYIPDKAVVKKLFDVLGPRFSSRPGGYTRILKLGKARLGDNAPRAIFELVERTPKAEPEAVDTKKAGDAKNARTAKKAKGGKSADAGAAEAKPKKKTSKKAAATT